MIYERYPNNGSMGMSLDGKQRQVDTHAIRVSYGRQTGLGTIASELNAFSLSCHG
jgi:hypothetical protein